MVTQGSTRRAVEAQVAAGRPKPGESFPSLRDNLQEIPGITYACEELLAKRFDIRTFRALAERNPAEAAYIARDLNVAVCDVERWVNAAKKLS